MPWIVATGLRKTPFTYTGSAWWQFAMAYGWDTIDIPTGGEITPKGKPQMACGDLIGHLEENLAGNTDEEVNGGQCTVHINRGRHESLKETKAAR